MAKKDPAPNPASQLAHQRWDNATEAERREVGASMIAARWDQWRKANPEKWAAGEERRKKRAAKKRAGKKK